MISAENSVIFPALPDLIWGSIAFVIIAVVMYKLAWPAFIRTLDERTEKIDNGLSAAAHAREELEIQRAKVAVEVDDARREAALIREKAQGNAAGIIADAQKEATVQAQRIHEVAQRQIQAEKDTASQALRQEVGELAAVLASRIVGEASLDKNVSKAVVDRFLDDLNTPKEA